MSLSDYHQDSVVRHRLEEKNVILEYARKKRDCGQFNDVTITVDDVSIRANSLILSCYSAFFEEIVLSSPNEKQKDIVEIKGFDVKSVKQLVEYMYTGEIAVKGENVINLLAAANYLQLDEVKEFCLEFLEGGLTPDNCLAIVTAANLYKNHPPLNEAYQYMSENLIEISQKDNFKELSKTGLISLIGKLNRNVVQDTSLFNIIVAWVKCNEDHRKLDFPALFQTLNLDKFSNNFLVDVVAVESLVKQSNDCLNLVISCITRKFKEMQLKENGSKILCIGGNESGKVMEIFSLFGKTNSVYPDLPNQLYFQCALKHNNYIYCIGGAVNGVFAETTDHVYRLNINDSQLNWEEVAPMVEKCSDFGAAVLGETLVVAGGYNKGRLSKSEMYKVKKNQWKTIAPMKHKRSGNALVTCAGSLYAVGGWDSIHLSSVERLSEVDQQWEDVASLQTTRRSLAAVSCGKFIYAIGGDSPTTEKTVEKYDTSKNEWSYAADMNFERKRHSACVLQGNIYVAGGLNASGDIVKQIECYDPLKDRWTVVGETDYDVKDLSLVVI